MTHTTSGTPKLAKYQLRTYKAIGRGLNDKEIAVELNLALGTVKVVASRLYKKLGTTRHGIIAAVQRELALGEANERARREAV